MCSIYRLSVLAFVFSHFHHCEGQTFWAPAGLDAGLAGNYYAMYESDDGLRTYIGGWRDFDPEEPDWQNMLMKLSPDGMEYIPVPGGINSIVEYHDTLFIGGAFETNPAGSDTIPAYNIEYWLNGAWHRSGVFDAWDVRSLRVLDDTLYAVGSFAEVDGQPCSGMIKLVNGVWQPLPDLPIDQGSVGPTISGIVKYNGTLIIEGNFYIGAAFPSIAYLDGNTWHTLGPGLEAGFSSIRCMSIYQGDLYVGGQIAITQNNPGRGIMRWDGMQFHALGEVGLQRNLGDDTGLGTVGGMIEHDGLLYVGGTFRYAGGVEAKGVATWDGIDWCSVPGNLSDGDGHSGVTGAAFFHDTLFVICGYMADGDSVNLAAKFIGESYAGPCESDVQVIEQDGGPAVRAYFTSAGSIETTGLAPGIHLAQMFDTRGRLLSSEQAFRVDQNRSGSFDPGPLPPGVYLLNIDGTTVPLVTLR